MSTQQDSMYGSKSDVWALGCVLYELASTQRPFHGHSVSAVILKIIRASPAPLPPRFSKEFCGLVDMLLSRDAETRPSITQVLELEVVQAHVRKYLARVPTPVGPPPTVSTAPVNAGQPVQTLLAQIHEVLQGGVQILRAPSRDEEEAQRKLRRVALQDCFEELAHQVARLTTAIGGLQAVHAM